MFQNVIKGYNDFLMKTGVDVLRLDKVSMTGFCKQIFDGQ